MKVRVSGGSTGPETGGCCAFHLKPLALSRTLTGEVSQWLGPDPPDHGGVVKREKSHELALESRDAVCVACVGVVLCAHGACPANGCVLCCAGWSDPVCAGDGGDVRLAERDLAWSRDGLRERRVRTGADGCVLHPDAEWCDVPGGNGGRVRA